MNILGKLDRNTAKKFNDDFVYRSNSSLFCARTILNSTKLEIDALGFFPPSRGSACFLFCKHFFFKFGLGKAAVTVKEKKRSDPNANVVFAH